VRFGDYIKNFNGGIWRISERKDGPTAFAGVTK